MISLRVQGLGLIAPGIVGRHGLEQALAAGHADMASFPALDPPEILDARERRRASPAVRLALRVAQEAMENSGLPPTSAAMVFASSLGDGSILNELLQVLVDPQRVVSPTRFHNSVHNSALAYWSISTRNRLPGTSLAAHDFTFGAALLKSAAQVASHNQTVLLVIYDAPFPEPLNRARPLLAPFAAAFVLTPADSSSGVAVELELPHPSPVDATPPVLSTHAELWQRNPAAKALPFAEALVRNQPAEIVVAYRPGASVRLGVQS